MGTTAAEMGVIVGEITQWVRWASGNKQTRDLLTLDTVSEMGEVLETVGDIINNSC